MAGSIFHKDFYNGGRLFRSKQDLRRNQAIRPFNIRGLTTANSLAAQQAEATDLILADSAWATHPGDDTLPLEGVDVRMRRSGIAIGAARYGHSATSNPIYAPFDMARRTPMGYRKVRTYRRRFATSGSGTDTEDVTVDGLYRIAGLGAVNAGDTITTYYIERDAPVFQIRVQAGRLSTHPAATVDDLAGSFNTDAVLFNGGDLVCGIGTLRFYGVNDVEIPTDDGVVWFVEYIYHYCPAGWGEWKHVRFWVDGVSGGAGWHWWVFYDEPEPDDTFADAFPLFDGSTGPEASA